MLNLNPYCKWPVKALHEHAETCADNKEIWNLIRYAKPCAVNEHDTLLLHLAGNPHLTRNHMLTITLGLRRQDAIAATIINNQAATKELALRWICGVDGIQLSRIDLLVNLPCLKSEIFEILYSVLVSRITYLTHEVNKYMGMGSALTIVSLDIDQPKDLLRTLISKRGCPPHLKADHFMRA